MNVYSDKKLVSRIKARQSFGREIATELISVSRSCYPDTKLQLEFLAARILVCNSERNTWIGIDSLCRGYHHLPKSTVALRLSDYHQAGIHLDERYHATGRYWRCNSKLCPDCLARQSRQTRTKIKAAIDRQYPRSYERYSFVTFTIPNPNLSLILTREIVNRAWCLFRKRKMCVSLLRGGCKAEEFTVTANGFHYHLHCIFLHRFILYSELRRVWTECVETAFNEVNHPFVCNNKDKLLSVCVRKLDDASDAVNEVCKYITKFDSWSKIRRSDLVEIALIRRWHRMFELFGSFAPHESASDSKLSPILDTGSLTDGTSHRKSAYWRDRIHKITLHEYINELENAVSNAIDYVYADLSRILDTVFILNFLDVDEICKNVDRNMTKFSGLDQSVYETLRHSCKSITAI